MDHYLERFLGLSQNEKVALLFLRENTLHCIENPTTDLNKSTNLRVLLLQAITEAYLTGKDGDIKGLEKLLEL